MGMEEDVRHILEKILEQNAGNKKAAAKALGVNPMTFWGWMEGTRNPSHILFKALDAAGARLLAPWDNHEAQMEQKEKQGAGPYVNQQELIARVDQLEQELAEAKEKARTWENMFRGAIEMSRAMAGTQGLRGTTEGLEKMASSMGK